MKSAFKKITKNKSEKNYFGHPELDAILGNNLKKGTMILIEEDLPTSMYIQLLRYFIGSGIHMDQKCIIYDVFYQKWKTLIPGLFSEKRLKKNEEAKEKEKGEQVTRNQIAWRYDEQKIKLKDLDNMVSKDIPKLDLSKQIDDDKNAMTSNNVNSFGSLRELYDNICESLVNILDDENDTTLKKIALTNIFGHFSKIKFTVQELTKFLQALKSFCRASHILLVMTVPQNTSMEYKNMLHFYFDLVLKIEPLFEREELEHFHGMLHFLKISNIGNYNNYKLETLSWGIKASSKRKLEIDRLYLSPEREQNLQQQQQTNKTEQQQEQQPQSAKVDF